MPNAMQMLCAIFFSACILQSCRPLSVNSALKDVYKIDGNSTTGGNERRREADILSVNWTVKARGCTGILLNPYLLITAHHCKVLAGDFMKSGFAVLTDSQADLQVESILESDEKLDFALVKMKWVRPMPSQQTFPPWIAADISQIFTSPDSNQGDSLFTVGFPDDTYKSWKATYAEGQAKKISSDRLYYNVGIINGNSGGGVLKKDNFMLVTLAIGGTKKFGDAGWDSGDPNNPATWNFGAPMWVIYAMSPTLKKEFPEGRNNYLKGANLPRTQLFVLLEDQAKTSRLKVSGNIETEQIVLCPLDTFPCLPTTRGAQLIQYEGHQSGRKFFAHEFSAQDSQTVGIVALDKKGAVIGSRHIELTRANP